MVPMMVALKAGSWVLLKADQKVQSWVETMAVKKAQN
jgi:hypothetical protein